MIHVLCDSIYIQHYFVSEQNGHIYWISSMVFIIFVLSNIYTNEMFTRSEWATIFDTIDILYTKVDDWLINFWWTFVGGRCRLHPSSWTRL